MSLINPSLKNQNNTVDLYLLYLSAVRVYELMFAKQKLIPGTLTSNKVLSVHNCWTWFMTDSYQILHRELQESGMKWPKALPSTSTALQLSCMEHKEKDKTILSVCTNWDWSSCWMFSIDFLVMAGTISLGLLILFNKTLDGFICNTAPGAGKQKAHFLIVSTKSPLLTGWHSRHSFCHVWGFFMWK